MADTNKRETNRVFDIDEVAKQNPAVDAAKVRNALDAVRQLREQGISRSEFQLVLPFTRTRLVRSIRPR